MTTTEAALTAAPEPSPGSTESQRGHRGDHKHAAATPTPPAGVTLNLFGMPLGVAALGGGWTIATPALAAPSWPTEVLYGASATLWAIFTVVYVVNGIRARGRFRADLRHPLSGPFAAYIPMVAILLCTHYSQYDFRVFAWICAAAVAALLIVASQLIAHWLNGGIKLNSVHPGYFIPVVAGANVASIGFSSVNAHQAALGAFGAGLFFWLVIGTIVLNRIISGAELPAPLKPAMSAFLAAAATSNLAWIISHPGPLDEVQMLLTGVLVVMLVTQFVLLNTYRKLPFSPSWWIFTFPLGATTNYTIRWMDATHVPGWNIWAWSVLGIASAFVLFVATRTIINTLSRRTTTA